MKGNRRRGDHLWWSVGLDRRQVRRLRRRHKITCPICQGRFRGCTEDGSSALFWHVYFDHDYEAPEYGPAVREVLNASYGP